MDRYWRCGRCSNKRILKCPETGRGATSYPIRHLKNRHIIDLNADHQALPLQLVLALLQRLLHYLPSAEMTLDLEANEVEVKVLTSLASVAESTDAYFAAYS
jgi:hypothetical protein